MSQHIYDVAIVGGGISGTALFYELARYTNIEKIALFEKYKDVATLNSNGHNNSQTLHCGDIETNYTLDKAKKVKKTAKMVEKYALQHGYGGKYIHKVTKMALGVGEKEVEYITNRYHEFKELYPYLELWNEKKLKKIEPKLMEGRQEPIIAMGTQSEYSAIDFGKIAKSFIKNAQKEKKQNTDVYFKTEVLKIKKKGELFEIQTNQETYYANFVVVNAGAHSILMAQRMGYADHLSSLPIGGSFYYADAGILKSKVYTVQNPKLPFAAIHGDPDIKASDKMRFGPTAIALPQLERYHSNRFKDFMEALDADYDTMQVLLELAKDKDIRDYVFKNMMFEVPVIRKKLFLKDAQKIVPTLKKSDIEFAEGVGGLRPQVIDKENHKLLLGEASIDNNDGIIFNMTPSPGATSCLGNGEKDMKKICKYLGKKYDKKKFLAELVE
jgi:malate dehydrogenase (quinone)